jgi:hypothetical protein
VGRLRATLIGAAAIVGATAGTGLLLAALAEPDHPGPENSSPPPEGLALFAGAFVGCAVSVALLAFVRHRLSAAVTSWAVSIAAGLVALAVVDRAPAGQVLADAGVGLALLGVALAAGLSLGALLQVATARGRRSAARPPRA